MQKSAALFLVVFLSILLSACGVGPHAVQSGTAVERLMNVEARADGTYTVWLFGDSNFAYCTSDKAMFEAANKYLLADQRVVLTYRTINDNEQDVRGVGCTRNPQEGVVMELLLSIAPLSGQ